MVVQGVVGHNPTDAHDDWFWNRKDAEEVAAEMAKNS
jgi:hypothetical protein